MIRRIKNIFKRVKDEPQADSLHRRELKCQDVTAFPDERRILAGNTEIELTAKEYDLITYLMENRNRVFTREQLIINIWGYDYVGDTRAIDDLVKRVRKKILEAGSALEIVTVWGYGYKICD
jgi:DNA-binding response OmpR family regulator